jgi:NAD+ kinase
MIVKKIHFVIDNTNKAKPFGRIISKKNKNYPPKISDVIVVLGGDGFMLQTLKKYYKYNKPFYGMNRGTFGFLMNKFKSKNIKKNISKSKLVLISPLEAKIKTKKNKILSIFAINEVSLLRQSRQTVSLQILNGNKILIKKLISDGVLISTPAGSTAYNLSVHGPILSIDSKKIAVTPISPFRPRRWKGKILPSSSSIKIINLNIKKRPVSIVADNIEVRNIRKVKIKTNNSIKFKLLYDRNNSLAKKIKLEQIRKQIA